MVTKSLITVEELSDELHLNKQSVRRLMREKKIPCINIGRRLYCPSDALNKMIENKLQGNED